MALTSGEVWAREELAQLRARRFMPGAAAGFLIASLRRAAEVRAARPALARQARRWELAGAAAWLGVGAGGAGARRAGRGLAWWGACALMLDWHLGMMETPEGRPRALGGADAITLTRAWAVPLAWEDADPVLCAAAAASDVLDGALARRAGPTRAGRDLEGLVDAAFSAAALRGALRTGRVSRAAVAAESLRLAVGFVYALAAYFGRAEPPDPAVTRAARATSPVRAAGVVAAGLGRRRAADALVGGGALVSVYLCLHHPPRTSSWNTTMLRPSVVTTSQ